MDKKKTHKLTLDDILEIIRRRQAGEQINAISKAMGVHVNTIVYHLERANMREGLPKRTNVRIDRDLVDYLKETYGSPTIVCENLIRRLKQMNETLE